jgi:hypothetical protein
MFRIFLNALLSLILGSLKKVVLEIIAKLSYENITDEEKRKAAFEQIKQAAVAEGRILKDSLINLVIELAVQYLKKS